jgi:hypothetical protein
MNAMISEAFFAFLRPIVLSKRDFIIRTSRNREVDARFGLQLCDSSFVEFWALP